MNTQPTSKSNCTKFVKSQGSEQTFLQRVLVFFFVMQAALIGIQGSHDVLSGKPLFDVLQGIINQGIELILKAQTTQERLKKRDEPEAPLRDR